MSEEDIRKYLGGRRPSSNATVSPSPRMRAVKRRASAPPPEEEGYQNFSATHLLCPTCRQAMPVREKILLFLPDGDLYEYTCTTCGTSVGTRKAGV